MSRTGKKPVAPVDGVTVTIDGRTVKAKGPKGELSLALMDVVNAEQTARRHRHHAGRRQQGGTRGLGHHAGADQQHGQRRQERASRRSSRSRASASVPRCRARTSSFRLGTATMSSTRRPPGITIAVPTPTEVTVTGIDKQTGWPGCGEYPRLPQAGALQGQGRALRRASTSPAKKARRSKERRDGNQSQGSGAPQVPRPPRHQGACQRPAAPERLPLGQEHLCPDHRRCDRPYAGRRLDARQGHQVGAARAVRPPKPRLRSAS